MAFLLAMARNKNRRAFANFFIRNSAQPPIGHREFWTASDLTTIRDEFPQLQWMRIEVRPNQSLDYMITYDEKSKSSPLLAFGSRNLPFADAMLFVKSFIPEHLRTQWNWVNLVFDGPAWLAEQSIAVLDELGRQGTLKTIFVGLRQDAQKFSDLRVKYKTPERKALGFEDFVPGLKSKEQLALKLESFHDTHNVFLPVEPKFLALLPALRTLRMQLSRHIPHSMLIAFKNMETIELIANHSWKMDISDRSSAPVPQAGGITTESLFLLLRQNPELKELTLSNLENDVQPPRAWPSMLFLEKLQLHMNVDHLSTADVIRLVAACPRLKICYILLKRFQGYLSSAGTFSPHLPESAARTAELDHLARFIVRKAPEIHLSIDVDARVVSKHREQWQIDNSLSVTEGTWYSSRPALLRREFKDEPDVTAFYNDMLSSSSGIELTDRMLTGAEPQILIEPRDVPIEPTKALTFPLTTAATVKEEPVKAKENAMKEFLDAWLAAVPEHRLRSLIQPEQALLDDIQRMGDQIVEAELRRDFQHSQRQQMTKQLTHPAKKYLSQLRRKQPFIMQLSDQLPVNVESIRYEFSEAADRHVFTIGFVSWLNAADRQSIVSALKRKFASLLLAVFGRVDRFVVFDL